MTEEREEKALWLRSNVASEEGKGHGVGIVVKLLWGAIRVWTAGKGARRVVSWKALAGTRRDRGGGGTLTSDQSKRMLEISRLVMPVNAEAVVVSSELKRFPLEVILLVHSSLRGDAVLTLSAMT